VNKNGRIKVWLSENFQENQPSEIETTRLHKIKIRKEMSLESHMVIDLIRVVETCIGNGSYPSSLRSKLEYLKGNCTFLALFDILREYTV
jgi:hypothetical protein